MGISGQIYHTVQQIVQVDMFNA